MINNTPKNEEEDDFVFDGNTTIEKPLRDWPPYSVRGAQYFIEKREGTNRVSGIFKLTTQIDEDTTDNFIDAIHFFNRFKELDQIIIYINSPGGVVSSGVSLAMLLREQEETYKRTIICKVYGEACSAASIVLAAGTKGHRFISKHGLIMVHELGEFAYGDEKVQDAEHKAKVMRLMQKNLNEFLVTRILLSAKKLDTLVKDETWIRADKALTYGFVDAVL